MYHFTIMISFTYFGVHPESYYFFGNLHLNGIFESIKNWKIAFLCAQENPGDEPNRLQCILEKNFGDVGREPNFFFLAAVLPLRKSFSFKKISSFVHLWH